MLWLLFNHRELCVRDFMEALEITQSKTSRHLAALRNAGLAGDRKEGLWSYYSLRPVKDKVVEEHLTLLRTSLARRSDAKQLLAKLDVWLKGKKKGETCMRGSSHSSATTRASSTRASVVGESR